MPEVVFFTIVSRNYMHYARTLMNSLKLHVPQASLIVCLCDKSDNDSYNDEVFEIMNLEDLDNIESIGKFIFRYTILEINTAIKPYVVEKLFDKGYKKVFYIDPDIKFFKSPEKMIKLLDNNEVLLTPHLTGLLDDEKKPDELDILRSGTYNLGYIGLNNSENVMKLVHWWQSKLYEGCVVDLKNGLFVDQKWMDLVPGMYDGVKICRDDGWNVAYWNLNHRTVLSSSKGYRVNDDELMFFHFSGFSPDAKLLSKHQNRFTKKSAGESVYQLCEGYGADLISNGFEECRNEKYFYNYFPNGVEIPDIARYIYRDDFDWKSDDNNLWETEGALNFMGYLNQIVIIDGKSSPFITRLSYKLYSEREDLKDAFPDVMNLDGVRYAYWYVENAHEQAGIDECFISPVREILIRSVENEQPLKKKIRYWIGKNSYKIACRFKCLAFFIPPEKRRLVKSILLEFSYPEFLHKLVRKNPANIEKLYCKDEFGVNVFGYVHAESGVGQSARCNIKALSAAGLPVSVIDVRNGNVSRMNATIDVEYESKPKYPVNLFQINADQTLSVLQLLGSDILDGKYNIGFWAWELSEFPDEWVVASNYLDEIWTPSEFCNKAISEKVNIPVTTVPHSIWIEPNCDFDLAAIVGIDKFVFLTMFDCLSVPERKNVFSVVDAFLRAFEDENGVVLCIKVSNLSADNGFSIRLKEIEAENSSIILISGYLERCEINKMLIQMDCFVSLHRSEGFGLGIAEAMIHKKPVIVTNWSGNTDFCSESNSYLVDYELIELDQDYGPYKKGQKWAEPSVQDASVKMKEVYNNYEEAMARGIKASEDILENLSPENIGASLVNRLDAIFKIDNVK